jgi:DNA-binding response OmpR family regulator
MRGTVLILGGRRLQPDCAEHLRADGLRVYADARPEDAVEQAAAVDPDVLVIGPGIQLSWIRELRTRVDRITSIIMVDDSADYAQSHDAGVDAIVNEASLPDGLLYEVRRAVILRRSGRRLPWSPHHGRTVSVRGWRWCRKPA